MFGNRVEAVSKWTLKERLERKPADRELFPGLPLSGFLSLSNDPGEVESSFFCYAATVLSPHRNVLIFTQRMHKPT